MRLYGVLIIILQLYNVFELLEQENVSFKVFN